MSNSENVADPMKIGPFLSLHLQKRDPLTYKMMESTALYAFEEIKDKSQENDPVVSIALKINGPIKSILDKYENLKIRSIIGDILTAEAPISVVSKLTESKNVVYMEASSPMVFELDKSSKDTKVLDVRKSLKLTGANVIIGIIDNGIDYTHDDFKNKDGSSRILYIWDQNTSTEKLPPSVMGKIPNLIDLKSIGYDDEEMGYTKLERYGREYTKEEIDMALLKKNTGEDPFLYVPQKNIENPPHGTHVTGIAAGNGSMSEGMYTGIAPNADIIFVKIWEKENMSDSHTLIDGINYIFQKADELGKPCCINISLGYQNGTHDGTSFDELCIDKLVMQKNGRAVVKSAGNDGQHPIYSAGKVTDGEIKNFKFIIDKFDDNIDFIYLWYSKKDEIEVSISSPVGETTPSVKLNEGQRIYKLSNGNKVEIGHGSGIHSKNGVVIQLKEGEHNRGFIEDGNWSLNVVGRKVIDGSFDVWLDRKRISKLNMSDAPKFEEAPNQKTITLPGTSNYIITVGNYDIISADINKTSSRGPTSDGRLKPEIACPGTEIFSALSSHTTFHDEKRIDKDFKNYFCATGTSQAAPMICGIIALILEKYPNIGITEIRDRLFSCCRRDSITGLEPNNKFGFGRADAINSLQLTL